MQTFISFTLFTTFVTPYSVIATPPRTPDKTVNCEILVVGGGLSGVATAYEGLLAGRTVCLTEITDWLGGEISSQGTSALDEYQLKELNNSILADIWNCAIAFNANMVNLTLVIVG